MKRPDFGALFQGGLCFWQLFLAGSSYSINVLVPAVESAATPPHALDGVWEIGMGAMHFLAGPIMIAATVFHTAHNRSLPKLLHSKTARTRLLTAMSFFAYLALMLAAYGTATSNRLAVFAGVALQSVPLAIGTSSN